MDNFVIIVVGSFALLVLGYLWVIVGGTKKKQ